MSKPAWLQTEAGGREALQQALRLGGLGLRRPWLCVACAAVLALLLVAGWYVQTRGYAPAFVIRVVEPSSAPSGLPLVKRRLAEYVREGVLTSAPLFEVMRKHRLYPSLLRKNPRAALQSFREDIEVDVYQNYFVETRAPGQPPRSARLTVSFRAKDPVLALDVTRELGNLIIEREREQRRELAAQAARHAARARDRLVLALTDRTSQALTTQAAIANSSAPDPERQVELVGLLGSVAALQTELETVERRANALDLGAAYERRGMGLSFQVVDAGALPSRAGQWRRALLLLGAGFTLGVPLVALALGAFLPSRGES